MTITWSIFKLCDERFCIEEKEGAAIMWWNMVILELQRWKGPYWSLRPAPFKEVQRGMRTKPLRYPEVLDHLFCAQISFCCILPQGGPMLKLTEAKAKMPFLSTSRYPILTQGDCPPQWQQQPVTNWSWTFCVCRNLAAPRGLPCTGPLKGNVLRRANYHQPHKLAGQDGSLLFHKEGP